MPSLTRSMSTATAKGFEVIYLPSSLALGPIGSPEDEEWWQSPATSVGAPLRLDPSMKRCGVPISSLAASSVGALRRWS